VKLEARLLLGPGDGGVDLDRRQAAGGPVEPVNHLGDLLLGAVEHGQLHGRGGGVGGLSGREVAHEVFRLHERVDARLEKLGRGFEEVGRVGDEFALRVGGVALLLERIEGEEDAGVEARRGVVGEAEVDGDAVRRAETDAVDLARHAVRLAHEDWFRLGAVAAHEFHALARRDAVRLEENVELALHALRVPRLLDRGGAFGADAGHVAQFRRFLAEHAEGGRAKGVDDLVGVHLADAGHEAAAEVFADAVNAGGQLGLEADHAELVAVLRVVRPLAGEVERLAALHAGQRADDGHESGLGPPGGGLRIGAKLRDGVVVLLVEENDALKDTGERGVGGRRSHGCAEVKRFRGRRQSAFARFFAQRRLGTCTICMPAARAPRMPGSASSKTRHWSAGTCMMLAASRNMSGDGLPCTTSSAVTIARK